jgi:hypothetical protein
MKTQYQAKNIAITILLFNFIVTNGNSQTVPVTEYWNAKSYQAYWEEHNRFPVKKINATDSITIDCNYLISKNKHLIERGWKTDTIEFLELELTISNNSHLDIYLPSLNGNVCADLYEVFQSRDYNRLMQEDVMKKESKEQWEGIENGDLITFNWGDGPHKFRFSYLGNILDYGYSSWQNSNYTVIRNESVLNVTCIIPVPEKLMGQYKIDITASIVGKKGKYMSRFTNINLSTGLNLYRNEKNR